MSVPIDKIFSVKTENDFNETALAVFNYQVNHCSVYGEYVGLTGINPTGVKKLSDIPFLPIEFFKTRKILSDEKKEELFFVSSGTTGTEKSKHYIADVNLYIRSFEKCFEMFYGSIE